MKDLHTYGNVFQTKWVTIHDTAVNGTTPFDANAAAKAAGATPFKRPENGMFRPGSAFRQFVFDETGDTNASSPANDDFGGWGSLFSYKTDSAASDHGTLTILFKGNEEHAGFDNMTFLTRDDLAVVEDAGDGLHASRNALDSGYVFDVTHNYADGSQPIRFLAQGRDASATIDSALGSLIPKPADFHNEGDNEITGIHTSDGDPTVFGILGTEVPAAFSSFGGWRTFFTGQHGDNITWEITRQR
jgi:secreted PhoX family phosphatase